jgi:hypothetical protein
MKKNYKKILISLAVLAIAALSYLSQIDAFFQKTFLGEFDKKGSKYLNETIERAVYTFAIVRGINGIISVIQGTNVAVSPAGVGVQLSVGEVLDPVNDLVEHFSWIMLMSCISLGIQKVLMEIGIWLGFKIMLSFSMLMLSIGFWMPQISGWDLKIWAYKLALISLVIRFCIPAVAVVSENTYHLFLKKQYDESIASLEKVNREIKDTGLADQDKNESESYLNALKKMYENTKETVDIRSKILFLKDKISDYANYTVNLMIVFVLQTILIPLCVLWFLSRFVRYIGSIRPNREA